jgi:uronate dehydrogenase
MSQPAPTPEPSTERILITGAAGRVGQFLLPRLRRPDRILRLLDTAPLVDSGSDLELVTASVTNLAALTAACSDVDAVLHLAGHSGEAPWPHILDVNINGTYAVLEAARRCGVPRVILASSNHAVGFAPNTDESAPDYLFPRPDTYYGVSKVAMEALGSLYVDRYHLDVIAIRIGSCAERPSNQRMLGTWLSPDDCARLFEAALSVSRPGFRVVWGVSANTRNPFDLTEARRLGYLPQDDAEVFAAEFADVADDSQAGYLGGQFCSADLDAPITQESQP